MKTRDDLMDMTNADLREYAEAQGVKVLALDTKGTMVEKILGEYTEPQGAAKVSKGEDKGQLPPERGFYDLQGNKIDAPMWNLKIFSTQGDDSPVDIIVNCHRITVQRNVEVQVMKPYIDALRNSVIDTNMEDDNGVMVPRQIQTYPHQASPV